MLFLKNHAENEAGRLVPDLFLFFKVYDTKPSGLQLSVIILSTALNLAFNKN